MREGLLQLLLMLAFREVIYVLHNYVNGYLLNLFIYYSNTFCMIGLYMLLFVERSSEVLCVALQVRSAVLVLYCIMYLLLTVDIVNVLLRD